ncbi:MAG: ABC transporter ATP-binding protein [Myxococcaceae bacterium]|nr:ABC transporter ATP-binding protein [Myxococcaceae bacterium]
MSAVRFANVSKAYGDVQVVRDVSFEIPQGTLVTLLGPSGCGKTTTLRVLAGLELPTSGQVFIAGRDVTRLPAHERDVAMVFQSYALFPHLRVLENVRYGLDVLGDEKATEKARAALSSVGLEGLEQRWPNELSGGQQQRVALARALVLEPKVLLFDEPLSNLDARLRRRMREEIRELQQRLKLTAVYVTHDQDEALSISDSIIVMDKGVVVQQGGPRELYEAPATRFVADFMGESNVLEGRVEGGVLRVGASSFPTTHRDGVVQVAVRPHAISLERDGDGISGVVRRATYLGDHLEYTVDTELGPLFVVAPVTSQPFTPGDAVTMRLSPEAGGVVVLAR